MKFHLPSSLHLLSPLSREWYRHLTILGKDRILFINAALIEVPRAGLDFIFLFSFSVMDTPDTEGVMGIELCPSST